MKSATQATLKLLRDYESRNITFVDPEGDWPIVWTRAKGMHVWDAEGRKYLDMTAAFGVANTGHANPVVVAAGVRQMQTLLHAMGDVHPHPLKARLARDLSRLTFERWDKSRRLRGKTIFCNSGFEAVEAALKTALLTTGKRGVLAFEGSYHGLGYGALSVTHRRHFRSPFVSQVARFGRFVPWPFTHLEGPASLDLMENQLKKGRIGAVLVEPEQGRGGLHFLDLHVIRQLRKLCDQYGALLIADEVFTGFGRTGHMFACDHGAVIPDIICLGKAMTGGFPLSACVGRMDVMDAAWPESNGEAIHTSTFLGHPVGCAMALANLNEIQRLDLPRKSMELGVWLEEQLGKIVAPSRLLLAVTGRGLMQGLHIFHKNGRPVAGVAYDIVKDMLKQGVLALPEGPRGNVIAFTPPLIATPIQLLKAVTALQHSLKSLS